MSALKLPLPAVLSVVLLLVALVGCKDEDKKDPVDVAVDASREVDLVVDSIEPSDIAADLAQPEDLQTIEVDATTGATSKGATLDNNHDGWKKAACWGCHTEDEHNLGLDPYLCIGCHGTNGATGGHKTGTCGGCHGASHGADGFPDPLSCQTCHPN